MGINGYLDLVENEQNNKLNTDNYRNQPKQESNAAKSLRFYQVIGI